MVAKDLLNDGIFVTPQKAFSTVWKNENFTLNLKMYHDFINFFC